METEFYIRTKNVCDRKEDLMQPKKLLFVIPSLAGGGAERVVIILLRHLNRNTFNPHLVLFEKKGEYLKDLPDDVKTYNLNKKSRYDFPKLIWRLNRLIKHIQPQVIISFLEYANLVTLIAAKVMPSKTPLIISERNFLSLWIQQTRMRPIRKLFHRIFYPKANVIITLSKGVKEDLIQSFYISTDKIKTIYNPLDLGRISQLAKEAINTPDTNNLPMLIAIGRLTAQKGYPYLLRAFKKLRDNLSVKLLILGQGKEEENLKRLTKGLKIADDVVFMGFQTNPYKYLAKASVFVLSSLYEGLGNVILEAMACGVPVVSTRCPCGPGEIITDGVNGLLVPPADESALAEAILRLLRDESLCKRLAEAGRQRAQDFRVEKIIAQYEEVFLETVKS